MLRERTPGLPGGTSELNDIAEPFRISVHRLKRSRSVGSSNWTPITPTLSVALAATGTVPETVAPAVGAVIETDGGVPSSVVNVKSVDVARLPAASRERTRK